MKKVIKVVLSLIILLIIIANIHYKSSVETCVNAGHTHSYCVNGLK